MTGSNRRLPSGPNRGVLTTGKRRPEHWPDHDPSMIEDEFSAWDSRRGSPADLPPQRTSNHNRRSLDTSTAVPKQAAPRAPSMTREDSIDDIVIIPPRQPRKPAAPQPAPFPISLSTDSPPDVPRPIARPEKGKGKAAQLLMAASHDRMTRSSSGKIVISSDDNEDSPSPARSSPPQPKAKAFPMQLSPIRTADSLDEPEQAHVRTGPPRAKAKAFPMQLSSVRSLPDPESHKDAPGKPMGSRDIASTSHDENDKVAQVDKALSPGRTRRKVKPRPIVKAAKGKAPKAFPMSTEKGPMEDYISQAESDFSSAADALESVTEIHIHHLALTSSPVLCLTRCPIWMIVSVLYFSCIPKLIAVYSVS
jgi:hypothetical protein